MSSSVFKVIFQLTLTTSKYRIPLRTSSVTASKACSVTMGNERITTSSFFYILAHCKRDSVD